MVRTLHTHVEAAGNSMKSYARFYPKLYERLLKAPAFSNRQEVEAWLRDTWLDIHTEAGASKSRLTILQRARICPEQGWQDTDQDVCYLQSTEAPPIRIYVHNDGSVVVQQMHTLRNEILLAKPGARHKMHTAPAAPACIPTPPAPPVGAPA